MSTAAIKLYDILVEKGVDKAVAREAVEENLTREEARNVLATKEDLFSVRDGLAKQMRVAIVWVAGLLVGQVAVIVTLQTLIG